MKKKRTCASTFMKILLRDFRVQILLTRDKIRHDGFRSIEKKQKRKTKKNASCKCFENVFNLEV